MDCKSIIPQESLDKLATTFALQSRNQIPNIGGIRGRLRDQYSRFLDYPMGGDMRHTASLLA
jgi:hypothetical protein